MRMSRLRDAPPEQSNGGGGEFLPEDMHAEPARRHIEIALVKNTVRKFVSGRGGYCYECNSGWHWLLTKLGYRADMLNATVANRDDERPNQFESRGPDLLPKDFDHMCVRVRFGENRVVTGTHT